VDLVLARHREPLGRVACRSSTAADGWRHERTNCLPRASGGRDTDVMVVADASRLLAAGTRTSVWA
jgi:hypothetical protein